jgi:hypothetical protein
MPRNLSRKRKEKLNVLLQFDVVLSVNGSRTEGLHMTIDYRSTSVSKKLATKVAQDVNVTFAALLRDMSMIKHTWDQIMQQHLLDH